MFGGSGRGSSSGAGILQGGVSLAPVSTPARGPASQRPSGEYEDVDDPISQDD